MQDGYQLYTKYIKLGLTPDPDISLPDWSDTYRYLPKEAAHEYGKYSTSRTPYLREIMECLSVGSPIQRVIFMKPTQIGATEVGNNWFLYIAHRYPRPCMMTLPTVDMAEKHSKKKFGPSIKQVPELLNIFGDPSKKSSGNTLLLKEFPGGSTAFTGANSGASARSVSVCYMMLDDIDEFPQDMDGQGDPLILFPKRTDAFGNDKKLYYVSTPTERDISRIEKLFKESDQRYYHVPCPHCGFMQRLIWGGPEIKHGIKFERDEVGQLIPESVCYICKECHEPIYETSKTEMLSKGKWISTHPERSEISRGYQLSSLYSPVGWVSWPQMVQEFLEAKKYPESIKAWINTRLGEPSGTEADRPNWEIIRNRAEQYQPLTIPKGGLVLTAGVDVQDDRLAVIIKAWGNDLESWLIFWGEIFGDPKDKSTWDELTGLMNRTLIRNNDQHPLLIQCSGIDTGYHTHDVYNYVRSKSILRPMALKGMAQPRKPVLGRPTKQDVNYKGTVIKHGVELWPIGTDTAKSLIYSRLTIKQPGPGMMHFPQGLDDDYYLQLTSEKRVIKYKDGFPSYNWVLPSGSRNEALDCEVYALAAALRIGLGRKLMKQFDPKNRPTKIIKSSPKRKRLKTRMR
ncbi:MAG: phage terminase large subunit family protein [Candidatus Thorarchaeota archaeon]